MSTTRHPRPKARHRRRLRRRTRAMLLVGLHLAVLWAFSFAQPLLDLLGDSPAFFVARENTRGDIILLAVAVTLVPPAVLTLLVASATALDPRAGRVLQLLFVGALAAAFFLQLLADEGGASAIVIVPVSVALGSLAALLYARTRAGPMLLTVLSPAPLVFLLVFLFVSPVSKLVLPGSEVEAAEVTIPGRTPVVMIIFDELSGLTLMDREGRIDARRFPSFARLAGESTWYRNATTVADFTDRAVPAILTGELPDRGAAPIAADHPESLFTLLGGKYSFDVTEPVTDVCPERLCPGESASRQGFESRIQALANDLGLVSLHLLLPDELADDLPPVDRSFGDFRRQGVAQGDAPDAGADERGAAALEAFVERADHFEGFNRRLARAPRGPHLSLLHVQLPHNPYYFLPSGQRYPETTEGLPGMENPGSAGTWGDNRWLARQGFQRYLLQAEYADRLLGEAMARMRSAGTFDRTLFVVVADHGASFVAGAPHRAASAENLPQVASIPLFVKRPGQRRGRVDDANVNTTDVLPTIAARLGIRLPWESDGRPAERARSGGAVTVQPHHRDEDLTLEFLDFVRRRDAAVEQMIASLGDGAADLFAAGPDRDLVGRRAAELAANPSPARFELDSGGLFSSVDPDGPVVPALVTGEVTELPPGARLAIAVNRRVAAVTRPFDADGVWRFTAMVPPSAFRSGSNLVEAVAVTGRGADRRFARLGGSATGYRLARRNGRERIVSGDGAAYPVVRSAAIGNVDSTAVDEADVRIGGWAGGTDPPRPADRVVAFAGDRFLGSARAVLPRPALVRRYGRRLAHAGFSIRSGRPPTGPLPGSERAPFRVYAISGRRASLLPGAG